MGLRELEKEYLDSATSMALLRQGLMGVSGEPVNLGATSIPARPTLSRANLGSFFKRSVHFMTVASQQGEAGDWLVEQPSPTSNE